MSVELMSSEFFQMICSLCKQLILQKLAKVFAKKTLSHKEQMHENLIRSWHDQQFCDVVLVSALDGERVAAHRFVLAAACSYFKAMLTTKMRASSEEEIKLEVKGAALETLIKYFYTNILTMREDSAKEVYATAHMWQLDEIVSDCYTFLLENLSTDNCFELLFFAESNEFDALAEVAQDYIKDNFYNIYDSDSLLMVNFEYLLNLIKSNDLNVQQEVMIFRAVQRWVDHDCAKRSAHAEALLMAIRLPLIASEFLFEHVKSFCQKHKTTGVFWNVVRYHMLPNQRHKLVTINDIPRSGSKIIFHVNCISKCTFDLYEYCNHTKKLRKVNHQMPYHAIFDSVQINLKIIIIQASNHKSKTNKVICLNLKTLKWQHMQSTLYKRIRGSAVVLNGQVYVVGPNANSSLDECVSERWNPYANTWTKLQSFKMKGQFQTATVLNNKLYTMSNMMHQLMIDCYDPKSDKWTAFATTNIPQPGENLHVFNGIIAMLCYNCINYYNITANAWNQLSLPQCQINSLKKLVALSKELLLVIEFDNFKFFIFNANTAQWTQIYEYIN